MADGHKFSVVRHLSWRLLDMLKIAIFTYPTCIWQLAPQLEVIPFEFCQDLLYQKTRSPGLLYGTVSVILHLAIFMQ